MTQNPQNSQAEQKFIVCSHCGQSYPEDRDRCPFCQNKPSSVDQVGNKMAYVRLALVAAIIAAGFLFKCMHDQQKAEKAEQNVQTEQVQENK